MKKIQSLDLIAGGTMHYGLGIIITPELSDDEIKYLSDIVSNCTGDSNTSSLDEMTSLRAKAQEQNVTFLYSYEVTIN